MDPVTLNQIEQSVNKNVASLHISLEMQRDSPSQQSPFFLAWRVKAEELIAQIEREDKARNFEWLIHEMNSATEILILERLSKLGKHYWFMLSWSICIRVLWSSFFSF